MVQKKRVLLPQPIEAEALSMLESAGCEIIVSPDRSPESVFPLMKKANGIVLRTGIHISRELLTGADALEVISRTGGGFDNVDVQAATEKGIIVTSNIGVNTGSVVEHCLALMLSLTKQLPVMDRSVRSDQYSIRYRNLPRDLREKTLGLIGFGRIGAELGRVCRSAFRMRIVVYDPFLPETAKAACAEWAQFVDIGTLFSMSDIVSIHVPLTEETRHAVGAEQLSKMKPDSLLINTSRGAVIEESALIRALRERRIGGAGLDVLEQEPPPADSPLFELENVILTPHTAALTRDCVIRMATEAARCVIDVFEGREPANVADREVLKTEKWKHLKNVQ
jgi:D-3-phosphoglycerate dehydrogenase